ncbi:imidazole glycerol phosphate synthase subunit HisH [Sabulicella glaciei]|uniref:Imidazole glycerol phosphate synthase subunit HisH n=1 Tax=Sabulicella glaciei TaxID=2984948 RepID=A0ABT3NWV6_9PROT|nr:imidazole glycerol phosphate synthase subunit HisH [Roseococcus sp. MDT2-1-1]MCW8086657.1 imidazole glycerol phosphate synthase subunit HisH [Roseococcus sp. MDT2-1-1]
MRRVVIVDPGSGNLASVRRAVERAAEAPLQVELVREASALHGADAIIMPGQGAFAACRAGLDALEGMVGALYEAVRVRATPFLGICVGMQLLAERGLEHGETPGLAWLQGEVAPMDPRGLEGEALPLPQMGWNGLDFAPGAHPLLAGLEPGDHAYFVHSYSWRGTASNQVLATTDYGGPVVAIVGEGNIAGTQFHVEKSAATGLSILRNFLAWRP